MCGGYFSIKSHESCQVRKEAAISGKFYVENTSIEELTIIKTRTIFFENILLCLAWLKECDYMSYTALYRKYRPAKFSEIIGQEHITKTLKNQIIANRVGHAYLLTGGRGTR